METAKTKKSDVLGHRLRDLESESYLGTLETDVLKAVEHELQNKLDSIRERLSDPEEMDEAWRQKAEFAADKTEMQLRVIRTVLNLRTNSEDVNEKFVAICREELEAELFEELWKKAQE